MSSERNCSNCRAPLQESQDWCLQCGASEGKPLRGRPGWRSAASVIGASLVLALGAAAAAYAAFNEHAPTKKAAVAQTPPVPATTPPGTVPGGTAPPAGTTPSEPGAGASGLPKLPASPPSIPSTTIPSGSEGAEPPSEEKLGGGEGQKEANEGQGSGSEANKTEEEEKRVEAEEEREGPAPILLDTNAASVYNPYDYPESRFGDPSLAIDGEATTAWKVKVNPERAPEMAEGLAIDLKAQLSVSKLTLITNTKGMTVQVYGTKLKHLPGAITAKGWVKLSGSHVVKKHKSVVSLKDSKEKLRQILIWLVKAPSSSTPEEPGQIAINEVELYERPPGG